MASESQLQLTKSDIKNVKNGFKKHIPTLNRPIFKVIQIFATIGLLALVCWQVGLFSASGRAVFIETLSGADFGFLLLSIAVGFLINMSSALKWFMLTQSQQLGAGYWRIFSYYLIGQFYNLFLPTSVGGDVVRSYELGKFSGRQADALASVFVERYTGVLVLLLAAGLAVLSQLSVFNVDFVIISLVAFTVILSLVAWMVFDSRLYDALSQRLRVIFPLTNKLFSKLDKLLLAVARYKQHRRALVWAFINSLVFYLIAVLNVYVSALVFDANVALVDVLVATPIIMLIMNIPLSVGNIGLMEFAYINVLQLMGYSPALGLSVAILMRLKSLLDGALGGVLHPLFVTQKH